MPIATRTFRVFVSSTFEDLRAEREALQRDVFPTLRALCEKHGARFQAIDLRWGVRDEAALDQQTVQICLREIRRCQATGVRPNFMVLLGERYGWQPLPARIPAAEMDAFRPHLPKLACDWYWLDENAVPREYCLQPRSAEFDWNPVEQTLREALVQAALAVGLPKNAMTKYEASVTHQEILAADREHVFAFVKPNVATDPRLDELKSHLRVYDFDPTEVLNQLQTVIEEEILRFEDRQVLELEIEAHDRFAEERCRIFTGRTAVLDSIAKYIRGPERRPLVLRGESGSGKSAVMAKASLQYRNMGQVIRRFIGVSPKSASGHALLTSLCQQISPGETPIDYSQLEAAFQERLKGPLFLFIDAVDQLPTNDPARRLSWLPEKLPPNVKVIVSTTDEANGLVIQLEQMTQPEGRQALEGWLHEAGRTLQPWQRDAVLSHFDRCRLPLYLKLAAEESKLWKSYAPPDTCTLGEGLGGIIDTLFARLAREANHGPVLVERCLGYLAAARFGLTEDEILDVLTADDAVWKDFDERKRHEVSHRQLPIIVWSRLWLDLEPYLTEQEVQGGTTITFYHRQLAERVVTTQTHHIGLAQYFAAKSNWSGARVPNRRKLMEVATHMIRTGLYANAEALLADFDFVSAKCAAELVGDLQNDYNLLFNALPEMQVLLEHERQQSSTLAEWTKAITQYCQNRRHQAPIRWPRLLRFLAQFSKSRLLSRRPPQINSCLAKDPPDEHHQAGVERLGLVRAFASFVEVEGQPLMDFGKRSGFFKQQAWNCAPVGVLQEHAARHVGERGEPLMLRRWPAIIGHTTAPRVLRVLDQIARIPPHCLSMSLDGRRAVSSSQDTLVVWDLHTGTRVRTFQLGFYPVLAVALSANGRWCASAVFDHTRQDKQPQFSIVKLWDLETGECRSTVDDPSVTQSIAITADGDRAVWASACGLKVLDLHGSTRLRTLVAPSLIECVSMTPDGEYAVSGSSEGELRLWSLNAAECLRNMRDPQRITSVAITPDGTRALSGSAAVRLWDLVRGRCLNAWEEETGWIRSVAITSDGSCGASNSGRTAKLWHLAVGTHERIVTGHSQGIASVALTADGSRLLAGDDNGQLRSLSLRERVKIPDVERHLYNAQSISVAEGDEWCVTGALDNRILVWDLNSGSCTAKLQRDNGVVGVCVAVVGGRRQVVTGGFDKIVRLWDIDSDRCLSSYIGHEGAVTCVAVASRARRIVSGGSLDRSVKVWDLASGRCLRTFQAGEEVLSVATDPNGEYISCGCRDGTKLWRFATGVCELSRPSGSAVALRMSADCPEIFTGGQCLELWNTSATAALTIFRGHSLRVNAVAISEGGRLGASGGQDLTVRVWRLSDGENLALVRLKAPCLAVAITKSEKHVIAATETGEVLIYELRGLCAN